MNDLGEWDAPAPTPAPVERAVAWAEQRVSTEQVATGGQQDAHATPDTFYPSAAAFLTYFLAPNYRRDIRGRSSLTWCKEWYEHPEAAARVDAMWMAWEYLRTQTALGMSTFWLDHADRHMAVLLDPQGPFDGCHVERGHSPSVQKLSLAAPPDGLYPGDRAISPAGAQDTTELAQGDAEVSDPAS